MRYTILRSMTFFGFLIALWLLQLRGIWLLLAAGLMSAVTSYFLLQGPRAELSSKIESRVEKRHLRADAFRTAEDSEDSEDDEVYRDPSGPEDDEPSR